MVEFGRCWGGRETRKDLEMSVRNQNEKELDRSNIVEVEGYLKINSFVRELYKSLSLGLFELFWVFLLKKEHKYWNKSSKYSGASPDQYTQGN